MRRSALTDLGRDVCLGGSRQHTVNDPDVASMARFVWEEMGVTLAEFSRTHRRVGQTPGPWRRVR